MGNDGEAIAIALGVAVGGFFIYKTLSPVTEEVGKVVGDVREATGAVVGNVWDNPFNILNPQAGQEFVENVEQKIAETSTTIWNNPFNILNPIVNEVKESDNLLETIWNNPFNILNPIVDKIQDVFGGYADGNLVDVGRITPYFKTWAELVAEGKVKDKYNGEIVAFQTKDFDPNFDPVNGREYLDPRLNNIFASADAPPITEGFNSGYSDMQRENRWDSLRNTYFGANLDARYAIDDFFDTFG